MLPSRQIIVTGVGVIVALSQGEPGVAQAVNQLQSGNTSAPYKTAQAAPPDTSRPPLAPSLPSAPGSSPSTIPASPSVVPNPGSAGTGLPPTKNPPGPVIQAPEVPTIPPTPYTPPPDYLTPNSNPLLVPTQPDQVRPKGLQPITLRQALNLAQRNNPALQVSRLTFARSVAQFQEAQALNYPTLLLRSGFSRSQSASGDLAARASQNTLFPRQNNYSQTFSGGIGLDYNVFDFGRRSGQIGAAKSQARASELQVEADTEDLLLNVALEYYNLQQADENVRIARSAVRNAEASLRDTIALEQAGLGTRFDVLQAQVQLGQTQTTLTNALATQEQQRRQLAQRLNLPPDIDPTTADPVALAGEWTLPLADSIVLAFKNRAELQQQLAQRQAAEYQRQADLAALLPALGVSAQYNFLDDLRTSAGFGNGYSVSANVNWNLFDGGAALARARQQEANIAISENQFAVVRNQIQKGVEDAYYQLRSSRSNVDTSRLTVAQATEALRLARLRFQAGVGTQTDVINAENSLTRAEADLANAILSYNRARAQLIRSISNFSLIPGVPVQ